jgi:ABC-type branched-subunit amino acid transport system substrate-binding protein
MARGDVRLIGSRNRRRATFVMTCVAGLSLTVTVNSPVGAVSRTKPSGTLTFAVVSPFSGATAAFGPTNLAGCIPAIVMIERSGGILGDKKLACEPVDTRGDPADAVPIVQKLVTTTSHLVGALGPTSDTATATVPILNGAHVPMFAATGQVSFNQNHYSYFWRIVPADNAVGAAMTLYAKKKGYMRAAAVFAPTVSASGSVPTLFATYKHVGGKLVINETIPTAQASYEPEVAKIVAQHPQVIFTEATAQTSSTFLAELAQANGLVPLIGTSGTIGPSWTGPVGKAIGESNMQKYYSAAATYMPLSGTAFKNWTKAVHIAKNAPDMPQPIKTWIPSSFTATNYDAVNIMALAMEAAGSTNPVKYNKFIPKVVTAGSNVEKVYTFAEGLAALRQHKRIQYIGATGAVSFDKYHNSPGTFAIVNSSTQPIATFSSSQVTQLINASK